MEMQEKAQAYIAAIEGASIKVQGLMTEAQIDLIKLEMERAMSVAWRRPMRLKVLRLRIWKLHIDVAWRRRGPIVTSGFYVPPKG